MELGLSSDNLWCKASAAYHWTVDAGALALIPIVASSVLWNRMPILAPPLLAKGIGLAAGRCVYHLVSKAPPETGLKLEKPLDFFRRKPYAVYIATLIVEVVFMFFFPPLALTHALLSGFILGFVFAGLSAASSNVLIPLQQEVPY